MSSSRLYGNKGVTPGSYVLSECILTASNQTEIDIKRLISEIIITESIYTMSISAEIKIVDAVNLFEQFKLNGDEKIELLIKRKPLDNTISEQHKHTFYISEIVNFARHNNGSATYKFIAVSKHAYINNTLTINRHVAGTIGEIVEKICAGELQIKKSDVNKATQQSIACIIPKLRPFAAIKWLTDKAYSPTSAPFYFYETLKGKVKYKSYEDFTDTNAGGGAHEIDKRVYIHTPVQPETIGSADYYTWESRRIRKLSSELNLSKFFASQQGAFASTTYHIDINNKVYDTNGGYQYKGIRKLNEYDPYPKRPNNDQYGGKSIDSTVSGKNYYISLNSDSFDNPNIHSVVPNNIGKAQSYISTEDTLEHDIIVAGNFDLECGQIMGISVNKTSAADNESSPIDKMQSGKYLITTIIHKFSDEYTQQIEIKTNSFHSKLEDIVEIENQKGPKEVNNT